MNNWIRLNPHDHVIIALQPFSKGDTVQLEPAEDGTTNTLVVSEDVPKGHKILTQAVKEGQHILKFGYSIGKAKSDLQPGCWIHTHNMGTGLKGVLDYVYEPVESVHQEQLVIGKESTSEPTSNQQTELASLAGRRSTFEGYVRENGEVGIRNEIWIINTVGCINKLCEIVARQADQLHKGRVEGVYHFAHPFGCSQLGDDLEHTQKLLASLVNHPNAAGVLVMGLGCENNQIEDFKKAIGPQNESRVKFLKSQEAEDEIAEALDLIEELVSYAEGFKRETVPASRLKLGLKCGGSDGLSGITANPLVGSVSDRLIAAGGTAILTEVPEMFGAETILMNRAQDEQVFGKIVHLINDFKEYFLRHDQEIYENPSPGNKAGGITTLEEKSLGCTQKGGHAIVRDVTPYGKRVTKPGLNLLEAPGNDLVSVTALSASGAHIVCFTTGRGTPFGGPVPTVKLSTNSELANRKRNWIDFNAGRLLEDRSMDELTDDLWDYLLQLASGEVQTNNEQYGFREIAIFKDGVIL